MGAAIRAAGGGHDGPLPASRRSLLIEWLLLLVLLIGAMVVASIARPLERADNLLYDAVVRERPRAASDSLLIIGIDNRSLATLGQWPWPRDTHARLLTRLAESAPRAIGYDVLFLEPGPDPQADERLAEALGRAGKVALPYMLEVPGYDGAASAVFRPLPPLAAAASLGHAGIRPDRDGIVRGLKRLGPGPDRPPWPHLADAVLALARGESPSTDPPASGAPVVEQAAPRIRFAARTGGFQQASFVDVLEGRIPDAFLRDRIILVGATGAGLGDRFATPLAGSAEAMTGVELLANYIDGELAGERIEEAPLAARLAFSLAPLVLLMASLLLLGPRTNLWLGMGIALVVLAVAAVVLAFAGLWLPPANALAAIALVFPLWGWRRLDVANRYMAAELETLAAEPAMLPRDAVAQVGDPVARQIALMHAAIRDVRDLKRFIAESLDSLPDAALVTDLDGIVLIANEAARKLLGNTLAMPLEGLPIAAVLQSLHGTGDALAGETRELVAVIAGGYLPPQPAREWELQDGRILDVRLAFFSDDERRPMGWIVRLADITGLRETERQREEALRLLTHDMRSPQASILALLEAEGEAVSPDLRDRLGRYANQTLELADQYVQFARVGNARPRFDPLDLSDTLVDAVDDLYPLARARGIEIAIDLPEPEALVLGDRALLTRAIQNILGNALKYGDPGSRVDARVDLHAEAVRLAITDQGRGIAAEDLPLVFEPFRRLAPPDGVPGEPGAGLGLAFVKRVIERHGGEVFAHSTLGRGSCFGFLLPRAPG